MADDELMDGSAFSEDDLDGFDCDMDGDDFSLSTSQGFDEGCSSFLQKPYVCLEEDNVIEACKKIIDEVAEICSQPPAVAAGLLRAYKWSKEATIEAIMVDRDAAFKKAGIVDKRKEVKTNTRKKLTCLICYEETTFAHAFALGCDHFYCNDCWTTYLELQVKEGPNCVRTHCMFPDCKELVTDTVFQSILTPELYAKYIKFFYKSFVEDNPRIKWCPAAGCSHAIQVEHRDIKEMVECLCGFSFCFQCADSEVGNHLPATCEQVEKWREKASDESENVKWLRANTKRCPKCRAPIEKNGGCMHITCSRASGGCGHEFCWLCRGTWSEHGTNTGGYYKCNKYDQSDAKKEDDDAASARSELEIYMFFYHRYESHRHACEVAKEQLKEAEEKGRLMQDIFGARRADTRFLSEATKQLLENRRVLEYSYVFRYYFDKGEKEKNLFVYLQEDLEKHTNHLSALYEKNVADIPNYTAFCKWKEEVTNYTRVTSKFLENFTEGVAGGLTS